MYSRLILLLGVIVDCEGGAEATFGQWWTPLTDKERIIF
jgi:hypothetical protein